MGNRSLPAYSGLVPFAEKSKRKKSNSRAALLLQAARLSLMTKRPAAFRPHLTMGSALSVL